MYMTFLTHDPFCPDCAPPDPNTLYWVQTALNKWEQWPGWLCRRSGIDPTDLTPVGEVERVAA